ncbi:MAG: activator of ATPase 1 family protein [Microbacteriaceae bacterium]|nr:activator of ATPase 1 family protein [Microbacteriaceae bacterium]
MTGTYTAEASTTVHASSDQVWNALTDPDIVKLYYFGTTVESDWMPGHPITWHGEYEGKAYEDHGVILEADPGRLLRNTHSSGGAEHTLTYLLEPDGDSTRITLTQDNAASADEADHDSANWSMMLDGLKKVVEGRQ